MPSYGNVVSPMWCVARVANCRDETVLPTLEIYTLVGLHHMQRVTLLAVPAVERECQNFGVLQYANLLCPAPSFMFFCSTLITDRADVDQVVDHRLQMRCIQSSLGTSYSNTTTATNVQIQPMEILTNGWDLTTTISISI